MVNSCCYCLVSTPPYGEANRVLHQTIQIEVYLYGCLEFTAIRTLDFKYNLSMLLN